MPSRPLHVEISLYSSYMYSSWIIVVYMYLGSYCIDCRQQLLVLDLVVCMDAAVPGAGRWVSSY